MADKQWFSEAELAHAIQIVDTFVLAKGSLPRHVDWALEVLESHRENLGKDVAVKEEEESPVLISAGDIPLDGRFVYLIASGVSDSSRLRRGDPVVLRGYGNECFCIRLTDMTVHGIMSKYSEDGYFKVEATGLMFHEWKERGE